MKYMVPYVVLASFALAARADENAPLEVKQAPLRAAEAEEAARPEAQDVARFAAHLQAQGDFYRAIGEYKRALFLTPDAPEAAQWELSIAESYRLGEQFDDAAREFDRVAAARPAVSGRARLGAAKAYQSAGQHEAAIARARAAAESLADEDAIRTAHYVAGWSLLQTTARSLDQRTAEATEEFRLARGAGAVGAGAERILGRIPSLANVPTKNPSVAGMLGLIPGFGHFYIGEPGIGMSALVWNWLFGYALVESLLAKNYSLAVVLGLFQTMWYGGSIVGAMSGAERYNRDARLNAIDALQKLSPPGLVDETAVRRME